MPHPQNLNLRIESLLEGWDLRHLQRASKSLTQHYVAGGSLENEEELLAYLIVRFPATLAVLSTILEKLPGGKTLLDLGSGPGTASWATSLQITAIEREPLFIKLGKKLGAQVKWIQGDFCTLPLESHDWVLLSYSLGELSEKEVSQLLPKAWQAAQHGVMIVEPGTPRGYQRMILARDLLMKAGGFVIAPCPHSNPCPLQPPDWCHFSVRLERSHLHRFVKMAKLSYEDEKYSYVILTKESPSSHLSRLIKPPKRRSGHTILPLCTPTGLKEITVTRSQKELYKKARKLEWGDPAP